MGRVAKENLCRLVAKETKRDKREDLFAATPPMAAKKMLFSLWTGLPDMSLDFGDVVRVYFHAKARRRVCAWSCRTRTLRRASVGC